MEIKTAALLLYLFVLLMFGVAFASTAVVAINSSKKRRRAAALYEKKYQRIYEEKYRLLFFSLVQMMEIRTDVTEMLIDFKLTYQRENRIQKDISFVALTATYLVKICDEVKRGLDVYTSDQCVVSIKALIKDEEKGDAVATLARDSHSFKDRSSIYSKHEPFNYTEHYFIKYLIESRQQFICSNDLGNIDREKYKNPYPGWNKIFNASAVHSIANPDHTDEFEYYGFIMVDNNKGRFEDDFAVAKYLEVASIIIYSVIHIASALEHIIKSGSED